MRLVEDHNPGAYAVKVQCLKCGHMVLLANTVIDLDGPSFKAYYCKPHDKCEGCVPKEESPNPSNRSPST